ncbi:MAG: hypothetical protein QOE92_1573 [Chloroflexota bacterium]|jgi:hypothetical protein|nr:hypothetical protein [Chloroflexota bacterium]
MKGKGRLRRQAGQAMLEYSLISATIVGGFGVLSNLGVTQAVVARVAETLQAWNITLPDSLKPSDIKNDADRFNKQIRLH